MNFFERLLGDPEDKPLVPGSEYVPGVDLEADEYDPKQDEGDADGAEKARRKRTR